MNKKMNNSSDIFARLLLFVGFSGLIGLTGAIIFGIPLLFAVGFVVFAVVGLVWGLILLGGIERKRKLVLITLFASIVLAPIYFPMGIAAHVSTPYFYGYIKSIFKGPNIVETSISPDGNFEAYVRESPSIDPPNQSLYIQRSDIIHFRFVAKLAEDIDSIQQIHWSPDSDIVVFQTRCNLIATHLPEYTTITIPLSGEWRRSKPSKQSTFCGAGPRVTVSSVEFPNPGTFGYKFEGSDQLKTIEMKL